MKGNSFAVYPTHIKLLQKSCVSNLVCLSPDLHVLDVSLLKRTKLLFIRPNDELII